MIIKGTKQLGSFKRGVNIYVPKKKIVVPPAPSGGPLQPQNVPNGIPVATTDSLLIGGESFYKLTEPQELSWFDGSDDQDGTVDISGGGSYYRLIDDYSYYVLIAPNALITVTADQAYTYTPSNWFYGYFDFDEVRTSLDFSEVSTNPSGNSSFIPDSSWSPSLTITAA